MKKYTGTILLLIAAAGVTLMLTSATVRSDVIAQSDCEQFTATDGATILYCPPLAPTDEPTATPAPTDTATPLPTATDVPQVTETVPVPTVTPAAIVPPYQSAPECFEHSNDTFHTLWDASKGCHYDHEHGSNPFEDEVSSAFPGFELFELLGNVEIGHTNPSSPMENTHKHGGFKWHVLLDHPQGCAGFEGAPTGIDGSVMQYHAFGNYAIELESAVHSVVAMFRQCKTANPNDFGYVFVNQFVSFGQNISPYQGDLLSYPHYSVSAYPTGFGPYWSVGCIGQKLSGQLGACRDNLQQAQNNKASTVFSTKATGRGERPLNSALIGFLGRGDDTYLMLDWRDQTYPYTFLWLCSPDGSAYVQAGCEYNNTTTQIHEIKGLVPAGWDNQPFDTDRRVGRITAEFFVTEFGERNPLCTEAGQHCHPIKLVHAFVGPYASLVGGKGATDVLLNPERDFYFCNGRVCAETAPGAVPSGWVGQEN